MKIFWELAKEYGLELKEGQMTDEDIKYFANVFDSQELQELIRKAKIADALEKAFGGNYSLMRDFGVNNYDLKTIATDEEQLLEWAKGVE